MVLPWSVSLINKLQHYIYEWSFQKTSHEWVEICKKKIEKHMVLSVHPSKYKGWAGDYHKMG